VNQDQEDTFEAVVAVEKSEIEPSALGGQPRQLIWDAHAKCKECL
jgi:hypothetical protein